MRTGGGGHGPGSGTGAPSWAARSARRHGGVGRQASAPAGAGARYGAAPGHGLGVRLRPTAGDGVCAAHTVMGTLWADAVRHRRVGGLGAAARGREPARGEGTPAAHREHAPPPAHPAPAVGAPSPLCCHAGAHARSRGWAVEQPRRVGTVHRRWHQHLCDTFGQVLEAVIQVRRRGRAAQAQVGRQRQERAPGVTPGQEEAPPPLASRAMMPIKSCCARN